MFLRSIYDSIPHQTNSRTLWRFRSIEAQIDEIDERIMHIKQEKVSGDMAYEYLMNFEKYYHKAANFEKKEFLGTIIKSVEIFDEQQEDGRIIKSITFKFPIDVNPDGPDDADYDDGNNDGELGGNHTDMSRRSV